MENSIINIKNSETRMSSLIEINLRLRFLRVFNEGMVPLPEEDLRDFI